MHVQTVLKKRRRILDILAFVLAQLSVKIGATNFAIISGYIR